MEAGLTAHRSLECPQLRTGRVCELAAESEGPGPGLWYQGREAGQRDPFPVLWVVIYDLVR